MTTTPDTEAPPPPDADEPTGLVRVRQMASGHRPTPGMWTTLGMRLVEVGQGRVTVEVVPGRRHANGNDIAHGGLVAAMTDSATGAAVSTTLAAGQRIATVDLAMDYHRPVALGHGSIVAEAVVTHTGVRIAHADCVLRVGERVVATGRAVFAVSTFGLAPPLNRSGLAPPLNRSGLAPPLDRSGLAPPLDTSAST